MKREILLYSDTRSSADMLWFSGVQIHDPFFAFTLDGKKCAILGELEIGRARRTSSLDNIFDSRALEEKFDIPARSDFEALCALLKSKKKKALLVGGNFPIRTADALRSRGFDVKAASGELFPARSVKSAAQVKEIEFANTVASAAFFIVEEMLKESKIRSDGTLELKGKPLTSEFLRSEVEREAISFGADSMDTIIAGGVQACDPHETGHGVIRANSLIVADIFPRLRRSGYFGDMTRTFLKGVPSRKQFELVDAVLHAQALGISRVKAGVNGADVHSEVCDFFKSRGFFTECKKGAWRGYIHSTGHGVGLDIHEEPRLSLGDCILKAGQVVTVEPGLYYPEIGGCRIEDNVLVQKTGCRMLSEYHYNWVVA